MRTEVYASVVLCAAMILACREPEVTTSTTGRTNTAETIQGDWLVPENQVFDGGPGKDGIPSVDDPVFVSASEATYLKDTDLVLGVRLGSEFRAYPHVILDWHEIVNDAGSGESFSITYCPLTGSGIRWEGTVLGGGTTFGVSGLLYNSNLIPYDRRTDSYWSQMGLLCINGSLKGSAPETGVAVETTWKTWRTLYPATTVLSTTTGYSRPYGSYPYGSYRNDEFLIFPVTNVDTRLPRKTRVYGIATGTASKAYPLGSFGDSTMVLNEQIGTTGVVVVGNRAMNIATGFLTRLEDGTQLTFSSTVSASPAIMEDSEGNRWDVTGHALSGPRTGTNLVPAAGYIAYWFAWAAFHPETALY